MIVCIGSSCNENLWPHDRPIACTFTSPPYNNGTNYGKDLAGNKIIDDLPEREYLDLLQKTFTLAHQHTQPGGTLWINLKPDHPMRVVDVLRCASSAGWTLQTTFAWIYSATTPEGKNFGHFRPVQGPNPHWGFEHVYLLHRAGEGLVRLHRDAPGVGVPYSDKSNLRRFNKNATTPKVDRRCRGNVWMLPYETKTGKSQEQHPCPFPVGLPEMALRLLDLPGGSLVMDPFCGTASTGVAACRTGLDFVGIEMSVTTVMVARERLMQSEEKG